jgi:hypothetical protein
MSQKTVMELFVLAVSTATVILNVSIASADDAFDVTAGKGQITVTTKGHWHVNKDYSWKVVAGQTTLDKSKFSLTETSANVSGVPGGSVRIKGAVCAGTECLPFSKDITVN